jgi:hypothetical protein
MSSSKGRRLATAAGFVSGLLACLDAVRNAMASWPPDALWKTLRRPQKLELCGGLALIVVSLAMSIFRKK